MAAMSQATLRAAVTTGRRQSRHRAITRSGPPITARSRMLAPDSCCWLTVSMNNNGRYRVADMHHTGYPGWTDGPSQTIVHICIIGPGRLTRQHPMKRYPLEGTILAFNRSYRVSSRSASRIIHAAGSQPLHPEQDRDHLGF